MRYRLPKALGGGEVEEFGQDMIPQTLAGHPAVALQTDDGHFLVTQRRYLTPVEPPLPPEPPVGSVVLDKDGHAWQRIADGKKAWWCVLDSSDSDWADLNYYGQLTLLVPDPFAKPVELPWTNKFLRVSRSDDPTYPAVVSFGNHGTNGLNRETAREMARALWSAAAEEKP